jgi:hypothetical protein
MIGSINVNLPKRWDERKDVWEGWKQDLYHKSPQLFHTKVLKLEPMLQLLKSNFINDTQIIPPIAYYYILNISLF